ncbi:hypothetical protein GCM10009775_32500 [Microbacterium aoyamense]|uniref:Uncharacterized protein n=1 Tax=Microbacterium aoyamense TaxID=344166 RepID=A0ABN2PY15_9MICO|nr:hypothetical protein [Microbacterium aoyamense]
MTEREGTNEPGGADEIAAAHDALLAGRADLSETDALHLQSIMDRRSKAFETLSDTMKKTSETQQDIIDNLK